SRPSGPTARTALGTRAQHPAGSAPGRTARARESYSLMRRDSKEVPMRTRANKQVLVLTLIALLAAGSALAAGRVAAIVKAAHNATLNSSILVNQSGRTLYHLTSEKSTKLVWTGGCA